MGGSFNVGGITGQMTLDLSKWNAPVRQAQQDMGRMTDNLRRIGQQAQQVGRQMTQTGAVLTKSVTAPIAAATAAITAASVQHENAMVTIRRATGATTEQMLEFEQVYQRVFRALPNASRDVASVIGELNTRLEVSGEALAVLTRDTLDFVRVHDLQAASTARQIGQLYNALELELREIPALLDMATVASQRTGIEVDKLLQYVLEAGPAFEEMGFQWQRAMALFSRFEQAGALPQELLGSLNIVLTRMAQEGLADAQAGFEDLLERIRLAPTQLQAVAIAAEAFGSRVGGKVAADIRAGLFEIDAFVAELEESQGALARMAAETLTFGDTVRVIFNQVSLALKPVGGVLTEMLKDFARGLSPAIGMLQLLSERISDLPRAVLLGVAAFLAMAAAIGPLLLGLGVFTTLVGGALAGAIAVVSIKMIAVTAAIAGLTALIIAGAAAWVLYRDEITRSVLQIDLALRMGTAALSDSLRVSLENTRLFVVGFIEQIALLPRASAEVANGIAEWLGNAVVKVFEFVLNETTKSLSRILRNIGMFLTALRIATDTTMLAIHLTLDRMRIDFDFDSSALDELRRQANASQASFEGMGRGAGIAAGGVNDLALAGERLLRQLFPVSDLVLTLQENLRELAAVGRMDDTARSALGGHLADRLRDMTISEVDRVIGHVRLIDAVVAEVFDDARAERIQGFYESLFPGHQILDQVRGQLPELMAAMQVYDDAFERFAAGIADQMRNLGSDASLMIIEGIEQASPQMAAAVMDAMNRMFEQDALAAGEGIFQRLVGQEDFERIRADLGALEGYLREAVQAGQIDDDTAHLLGTALWHQLGDNALAMVRQLADEIPTLKEVIGDTFEELARQQDRLARAEGLRSLARDMDGIAFGLARLGPNFRQAAQAAQASSRIMQAAASAASGQWMDFAMHGLMAVADTLGLIRSETEKTQSTFDKMLDDLDRSLDEWGRRFVDTMIDALKTGEFAFKDFVESILEDLTRIGMQNLIVEPINAAIRGAFAQGAVFDGGNVIPFAKGGLIDRPTIFPMAKGMGLAGEAGPEAIFPLTRLPGGDLGLKAAGGTQVKVEVIDQRARGAEIERQEMQGPDGSQVVRLIVRDEVRRGIDEGQFDDSLNRSYGVRRRGISR